MYLQCPAYQCSSAMSVDASDPDTALAHIAVHLSKEHSYFGAELMAKLDELTTDTASPPPPLPRLEYPAIGVHDLAHPDQTHAARPGTLTPNDWAAAMCSDRMTLSIQRSRLTGRPLRAVAPYQGVAGTAKPKCRRCVQEVAIAARS